MCNIEYDAKSLNLEDIEQLTHGHVPVLNQFQNKTEDIEHCSWA